MLWLMLMGCGQAGTDEVAAVMLVDGAAWIERDGQRIDAVVGATLERGDVLGTGPDGSLLVHLRNDHVVRVDSDLDLAVRDIVMLDAPKADVPPGDQLEDLIYPEERARLGASVTRAERVAGWHARLTAAVAPSGASPARNLTPAPGAAPAEVALESKDDPASGAAEADAGERSERLAQPRIAPTRGLDDALTEDKKQAEPPPPPPPLPPPPGSPDSTPPALETGGLPSPKDALVEEVAAVPTTTLSALNARFAKKGDLRACVTNWANTLPKRPKSLPIRLVVRDGVVERAVVEQGGLRLPACALEALEGVGVDTSDGAHLTVDL